MAITREVENDYTREAADARRRAVSEATGVSLEHTGRYCFDPGEARGNIENFAGATQVPLGFAGPLLVNGEHAQGEFYIPLATSEGTLVASYNRGMKVAREAGGVRSTVIDDAMQRAPAFGFDSAYEARAFGAWVTEHFDAIKEQAESSTRTGRLRDIEQYSASKYRFLRFNFESGDAAGQNMSGRATAAACEWISRHCDGIRYFQLETNLATDKKASQVNITRTRGKRVVAEITLSSLPTQREALEMLGCHGEGKVRKFAEIVAAAILCGELSLGAAVVSDQWVDAHERVGRNR